MRRANFFVNLGGTAGVALVPKDWDKGLFFYSEVQKNVTYKTMAQLNLLINQTDIKLIQ